MKRLRMITLGVSLTAAFLHSGEAPGVASQQLDDLVVTATRTARVLSEVPASVTILDTNALRAVNPVTVDELFQTVVGVDIQGSGVPGTSVRVNLRGLTTGYQTERVLVLVDGRRVNDAYVGNAEFALLPADAIERIEILKGPSSVFYGSNAEGGVINIMTRRGRSTPCFWVRAAGGSYHTQHYQFTHGWKIGPVDYFLAASHVETDGYLRSVDGTRRDWRADHVSGRFGWTFGPNADLQLTLGGYQAEGTDAVSDRETEKTYQMATYERTWDEQRDAHLSARIYRNSEHTIYAWKFSRASIYDMETLAGELQQSVGCGNNHRLMMGAEFRRDFVDIEELAGPIREQSDIIGVFLHDEMTLGDGLQATLGVRNDSSTDYRDEWSPRVALLWQPTPAWNLFGSVARAFRAPSLSDRFVHVSFAGMEFVGNPDLKPETVTSWELGMRTRRGDWRLEAAVFLNDMDDTFDFLLDPADGVFRSQNITRMRVYGIEWSTEYAWSETLACFANYSYTEGQYETFEADPSVEGNTPAHLAPHKAAAGIAYRCPFGIRHTLTVRYVSARHGDPQNSPHNKMEQYVVADWRLRRPFGDRLDVTLDLKNLLDAQYEELPQIKQPGRTVLLGMEARF